MSKLDDLSLQIGRLLEAQERAERDRGEIINKLDELAAGVAPVPTLVTTLAELKPKVEKLERDRWLRLGAMAGLGLTSGGIGSQVSTIWRALTGGGH